MNPHPHPPDNAEFRRYLLNKQGKGPIFAFLFVSAMTFLVFLVTVLKPHRLYKNLISFLFGIKVTINGSQYKLHHLLLLLTGFYGSLYFFLLMQGRQSYPTPMDPYGIKMAKLDKKWVLESQSWLAFLTIICLLSIYRNSKLFSTEKYLSDKIDEYKKQLGANKKNE